MATTPEDKKLLPPYASYVGFMRLLESLRQDGHHLPAQIDRGVLSGMSGSAQTSMLKTLEALGLIDASGKPTKALHELLAHQRGTDQFKAELRALLEQTYAFLSDAGINLRTTTTNQVQAAFRTQRISGSTVSKCIAFYLAAAKEAGIEVSKYVRTPPMAEMTTKKRNSSARSTAVVDNDEELDLRSGDMVQLNGLLESDLHPALAGLLRGLPAPGQGMSAKERERFLKAFEAVLAVAHPTIEEEAS